MRLTTEGLEGDGQADRRYHGGPDKAVCCFAQEHYPHLSSITQLQLEPGAFGENFSFTGMLEDDVCLGDQYKIGDVVVEVSQPRQPCVNLARRFDAPKLPAQMIETGTTGFYVRVIRAGPVSPADMELIARPHTHWSIARLNQLMYVDKRSAESLREVIALEHLSQAWRADFQARLKRLG